MLVVSDAGKAGLVFAGRRLAECGLDALELEPALLDQLHCL